MGKNLTAILFVALMAGVIVAVDLLFFRHHMLERLLANIGIVLVFAAFYLAYLRRR